MAKKRFKNRVRLFFPISVKLVLSFSLIIFTVLIVINKLNSGKVLRDLENNSGEINLAINDLFAAETESRFNSVRKDAYLLLDFIRISGKDSSAARQASLAFFENSYYIASLCVPGYVELVNDQFFINNEVNPDIVSSWLLKESDRIERAKKGEPVFTNPSSQFGIPLIAMFYPWQQNSMEDAVVILFSMDEFSEIFGAVNNISFIMNMDGEVLVHTNSFIVLHNIKNSQNPLYRAFSESDALEMKMIYAENGIKYFGAAKRISMGGLLIFTSTEYELLVKRTGNIFERNIFLIMSIILLSIILIWLLSKTITNPIRLLINAVARMKDGRYDLEIENKFPDEIGVLSGMLNNLNKSLRVKIPPLERENIKKKIDKKPEEK